jgi:glycosyltransferase involved in cell wall biosynthesis
LKPKKSLTLLVTSEDFNNVHLNKDVVQLPSYLCREYGLEGKVIYKKNEGNKNLPESFRNLQLLGIDSKKSKNKKEFLIPIFSLISNSKLKDYLSENSKKIDFLMLFHLSIDKLFLMRKYKKRNPLGKIILKLDIDAIQTDRLNKVGKSRNPLYLITANIKKRVLDLSDLIICETKESFEKLSNSDFLGKNKNKLILLPNGFDEIGVFDNKIEVKPYNEKENIFLFVGRIGSVQKNTELIFEAIKKVDFKDWRFVFAGPVESEGEDFSEKVAKIFNHYPEKKEKVSFTGNIENRKELYEYYNRSKCFVLSSNWESFAIVLPEAGYFGNYIITTNVGAANDITQMGKFGCLIDIGDSQKLAGEMQRVINGEISLEQKSLLIKERIRSNFLWENIVKDKNLKKFFQ